MYGDGVARTFDEWAADGRDQMLAKNHSHSVHTILDSMDWSRPFSFMDAGCGNGWVVHRMASHPACTRAVGIDKSSGMIERAISMISYNVEEYYISALEDWRSDPFDVIFSMESLYYSDSVSHAVSCAYALLRPGGRFICGTDYYTENSATAVWADLLDISLQMHSESEWVDMFEQAGFHTSATHITDPQGDKPWKRNLGTLFLTGVRPE